MPSNLDSSLFDNHHISPIKSIIDAFIIEHNPHSIMGICSAGSYLYGTSVENQSDRDFVVVYSPSPKVLIYPQQIPTTTIQDNVDGVDVDIRFIPIGEFIEQSLHGNPTAFESLLCFTDNIRSGDHQTVFYKSHELNIVCTKLMAYYDINELLPNGVLRCIKNIGVNNSTATVRDRKLLAHSFRLAVLLDRWYNENPTPYIMPWGLALIYQDIRNNEIDNPATVKRLIQDVLPDEWLDPTFSQSHKLDVDGTFRAHMIETCLQYIYGLLLQ